MTALPAQQLSDGPPAETVEQRFRRLESQWIAEAGHFSSPAVLCNHPAFREIIAMGAAVVPLMLRDLQERPRLWVWALPQLTGQNPVPDADRGNIRKMSAAWLEWAQTNSSR